MRRSLPTYIFCSALAVATTGCQSCEDLALEEEGELADLAELGTPDAFDASQPPPDVPGSVDMARPEDDGQGQDAASSSDSGGFVDMGGMGDVGEPLDQDTEGQDMAPDLSAPEMAMAVDMPEDGLETGQEMGQDMRAGMDQGLGQEMGQDLGQDMNAGPGAGGCAAPGVSGTHAARYRWTGSSHGSLAYPLEEVHTLPDTTRWRVTAGSRNTVGYRPVYIGNFGAGGIQLLNNGFIDFQLSTVGLTQVRSATISILARNYSTGSGASFRWQTSSGGGSSAPGSVSSVGSQWYSEDATSSFPAGDPGVFLRIQPGPPSRTLVVSKVEVCFDAL